MGGIFFHNYYIRFLFADYNGFFKKEERLCENCEARRETRFLMYIPRVLRCACARVPGSNQKNSPSLVTLDAITKHWRLKPSLLE